MIKNTLKALLIFICANVYSQQIELVTGLSNPLGIQLNGTDLFICEHGSIPSQGVISKADLSVENPEKENIISNLTYPRAICLIGDELYFATNYLYKFNINEASPTPIQILNANSPRALLAVGDYLYISGDDRISRINLSDDNPSLETVINNVEARILAFTLKDDELYFGYSNKVSKIDLTTTNPISEDVITNLEGNVYSLAFYNNVLLIGMALNRKIVKLDIDAETIEVEDFITTSLVGPVNLLVNDDELFVAGGSAGNNVFKIENLSDLLGVGDTKPYIIKKVYPNPTNDYVTIQGINGPHAFQIINSNGSLVMNGRLNSGDKIDIKTLNSGIYYLKLASDLNESKTIKIIKN